MSVTWILAADRAKARLFSAEDNGGAIAEIAGFVNLDQRAHEAPRDRPPRTHDRRGSARHIIEPHIAPVEKASESFARTLEAVLERGRVDHRYGRLALIAPPRFLGVLRSMLNGKVRAYVVTEVPRNMTTAAPGQILACLSRRP